MDQEQIIIGLIAHGGDARSKSMLAMKLAKQGKIEEAKEKIKEAEVELGKAHAIQTNLIQQESAGNNTTMSLLMVHGQDHLMNAITVKDLANEMIGILEIIYDKNK